MHIHEYQMGYNTKNVLGLCILMSLLSYCAGFSLGPKSQESMTLDAKIPRVKMFTNKIHSLHLCDLKKALTNISF